MFRNKGNFEFFFDFGIYHKRLSTVFPTAESPSGGDRAALCPLATVPQQGVGQNHRYPHHRHDRDLVFLPPSEEPRVEHRHEEQIPGPRPTAGDATSALERAAAAGEGRDPDERCRLAANEASQN